VVERSSGKAFALRCTERARDIGFNDRDAIGERVALDVAPRDGGHLRLALNERDMCIDEADGNGEADDADPCADVQNAGICRRWRAGRSQKDRIETGPITLARLEHVKTVAEK
jgi:hypothetical protein